MRKGSKLFLAAGMALAIASSAMVVSAEQESAKDTLVVGVAMDTMGFDPANGSTNFTHNVNSTIYEQLVFRNLDTNELEPSLAESWEISEDGTEYTFHIRQGVKFHNGEELKASDVLFSWNYAASQGPGANLFAKVLLDECEVIDDYTIKLVTDGVYSPQLALLEMAQASILNEKAVTEADYDFSNPVGTGAYKYVSWMPGDRIEFEAFEDYWGGPAKIKNIVMRIITDDAVRAMELEAGSIDLCYNVSKADYQRLDANPNIDIVESAGNNTRVAMFNCAGIFADERLRKAVAYAVDTRAATAAAWDVGANGDIDGLLAPSVEGRYATGIYEQDIEKAKELMAEAGYPDGFDCVIITDTTSANIMMGQIFQSQLAEIGINAQVDTIESATMESRRFEPNGFDIHIYGWSASTLNADKTLRRWHNKAYEFDSVHWDNQEFSDLLDKATGTVDTEEANEYYKQAQEIFFEECPAFPTAYKNIIVAKTSKLQDFQIRVSDERHMFNKCWFAE